MTRRLFVVTAVVAVLAGGPAACSSAGKASPGQSAAASGSAQQVLDTGRRFSQCAREHGHPDFPDPFLNGDKLDYPGSGHEVKDQITAIMQIPECKAIMDQLQALQNPVQPLTAAELQKRKDFAGCMREHGVPEFPDPKADGTFPILGTPLEHEGESQRLLSAQDACKQFWDGKVAAS
jgi:hypothetical protein